jgi:hypothetical protein
MFDATRGGERRGLGFWGKRYAAIYSQPFAAPVWRPCTGQSALNDAPDIGDSHVQPSGRFQPPVVRVVRRRIQRGSRIELRIAFIAVIFRS